MYFRKIPGTPMTMLTRKWQDQSFDESQARMDPDFFLAKLKLTERNQLAIHWVLGGLICGHLKSELSN